MTKAMSTDKIGAGTKRTWAQWLAFLKKQKAEKLSHKEIADRIVATGDASGWWSQAITVAYEQHIGRRVPGQDCEGQFAASVSKTLGGKLDDAFARLVEHLDGRKELGDIAITRGPETSTTEKWRYWRCGLADGSRVAMTLYQKAPGKVGLGVGHERLESVDQVEHWRAFWKGELKELA